MTPSERLKAWRLRRRYGQSDEWAIFWDEYNKPVENNLVEVEEAQRASNFKSESHSRKEHI